MDANLSAKLELFAQLIRCGQKLSYWELTPELELIRTTCDDAPLFHAIFLADDSFSLLRAHAGLNLGRPVLYTNSIGLSWICLGELAGETVCRVHLMGPAFLSDISYISLEHALSAKNYPRDMIVRFMEHIRELPTVGLEVWMRYALMLHCCLTGTQLEISDLQYEDMATLQTVPGAEDPLPHPKDSTWYAEQMLMKMVEEGRLDYQKSLTELSTVGGTEVLATKPNLRKMKNYMIAMNSLVVRSAIRGGLDTATAYHLGEMYLDGIETVPTMTALMQLNSTMCDDFIQRVHKVRTAQGVSQAVLTCCNYIDTHLGEKLTMGVLAAQVGYAEYYLAQKFKKEIGMSVAQYVKNRRVEQAKLLLKSTDQSVSAIAESLGFCNSSYFSDTFRSQTGMTPAQYRG